MEDIMYGFSQEEIANVIELLEGLNLESNTLIKEVREVMSNYKGPMTNREIDGELCSRWRLDCDCDNPLSDTCKNQYIQD